MAKDYFAEEIGSGPSVPAPIKDFFSEEIASPQAPGFDWVAEGLKQTANTIGRSGKEYVSNIVSAIAHPIQTAKGVGTMAKGVYEKFTPGVQAEEASVDALKDFYVKRYGGLSNIGKTATEDPVGFLSDLSALLGGVGFGVKALGTAGKIGKVSELGKLISEAGQISEPAALALKTVGKVSQAATQGRRIAPFGSKVDQEVVDAARYAGVDLPASAITKSKAVPIIETIVSKGLFGDSMVAKVEKAAEALNRYADRVIQATGKSSDMSDVGMKISKAFEQYKQGFIDIKNKLYEKASIPGRQTNSSINYAPVMVQPTKSLDFVSSVLADKARAMKLLGKSEDIGIFSTLRKALANPDGVPARVVKSALKELNNKLKNFNDPVVTGNKGSLTKLAATLSEELDDAIRGQRPDLAQALDTANKYYQEGLGKINSEHGKNIVKLSETGQYDKIVPTLFNKNTSADDISKIIEISGPQNVSQIQSAFLEKLFNNARGATGNFTPAKLAVEVKRYGIDKLSKLLTPEQMRSIDNIINVSKGLGRAEKVAGGSQTAFLTRLGAEAAMLFTNPTAALTTILGDAALSKFISSPTGQKLLSTGVQLTGKTGKAMQKSAPKVANTTRALRQGNIIDDQQYNSR